MRCVSHLAPAPGGRAQVNSLSHSFEKAKLLVKLEQLEGAPGSETDLFMTNWAAENKPPRDTKLALRRRTS